MPVKLIQSVGNVSEMTAVIIDYCFTLPILRVITTSQLRQQIQYGHTYCYAVLDLIEGMMLWGESAASG
jgi:hypothetical protein